MRHLAVIMDGNRRWAKEHGLPALSGHRKVADDILEPLIEYASEKGIEYITFWAWSTENWKREKREVEGIMRIFRHIINDQWERLHQKGVRIKVIGDISKFDSDIQESLVRVVEKTKNNKKITAIFALGYGGRDEILRAIEKVNTNRHPAQRDQSPITNHQLTKDIFAQCLDTSGIPDPEMIVRTSGEKRLSGFLLWQCEYSELYFPSWHMPEFTREKLDEVLEEYGKRQRRFGK